MSPWVHTCFGVDLLLAGEGEVVVDIKPEPQNKGLWAMRFQYDQLTLLSSHRGMSRSQVNRMDMRSD